MTQADRYLVNDIQNILENGYMDENPRPKYEDGTPAHTISVNHVMRKYDLSKGEFPVCTLRPQAWKTGIREIFTIYQHPTNVLSEMRARYDLIHNLIDDIKKDPYGRRKVVSLWQETDLRETPGLAPCAFLTMWNVRGEYLDMSMIQRSGDMLTASGAGGINEIQYAALLMMVACATGKDPGVFTHFVANEQIYDRHMDNAQELLRRAKTLSKSEEDIAANRGKAPLSEAGQSQRPVLILNREKGCSFEEITIADFEMKDYSPVKPQLTFELGI